MNNHYEVYLNQHSCLVSYQLGDGSEYIETFTLGLGTDSMHLMMNEIPRCDRILCLRLVLPIWDKGIEIIGRILKVESDGDSTEVYITYEKISPKDYSRIRHYVELVKKAEEKVNILSVSHAMA